MDLGFKSKLDISWLLSKCTDPKACMDILLDPPSRPKQMNPKDRPGGLDFMSLG